MSLISQFKEAWGNKSLKMAEEREKEAKLVNEMIFNHEKYKKVKKYDNSSE